MGNKMFLLDVSNAAGSDLSAQLARCGFVVQVIGEIDGALGPIRESAAEVAIIRTGETGAVELCRSLQRLTSSPVVVICRRREERLVVRYLEAGADSVLVAPLSRRELAARIGVVLGRRSAVQPAKRPCYAYQVGDLLIDTDTYVVSRAGRSVSLTPTEFRLLVALARGGGEVVSHVDLLSEVWGTTGTEHSKSLRLYIRYLRQKLGDDQARPRVLLNHRGIGYRLAECRATNRKGTSDGSYP